MTVVVSEKMDTFLSDLRIPDNSFQQTAFEQLRGFEFPTTRDEYWKYTRLGKISRSKFTNKFDQKQTINVDKHLVSDNYIIVENGIVRKDLSQFNDTFSVKIVDGSSPSAITVNPLDVFTTLNRSAALHAIEIEISTNKEISEPLQIIYLNHGKDIIANNQLDIHVGMSAKATITLTNISDKGENCFNNMVTTVNQEANSHFTLNKIQADSDSNFIISTEEIVQAADSNFKINTFTLTGLLVRNNINIAVAGQNCETYMNGAVITKGKQHVDNHTFVDHQVANCYSNENYKYILDGDSTGVFNGRVIVRQDAQIINAYQNNGNILLSKSASINSKPELEIYADDVKCSHGSTTGQLDEDAIFYLQTRGISKENAKKLLVSAFIGEVIESVEDEKIIYQIHILLKEIHHWDF